MKKITAHMEGVTKSIAIKLKAKYTVPCEVDKTNRNIFTAHMEGATKSVEIKAKAKYTIPCEVKKTNMKIFLPSIWKEQLSPSQSKQKLNTLFPVSQQQLRKNEIT